MFGMGFSKRVVENFTQLQGSRPVAVLFDSTAGVGKHADIDAVLVHHVVGLFDEMSVIVAPQRVNAFLAHLAVNGIVPSSKSINRPVNSDLRHRPRRRDRYPRTIPRSTFLCRSALADGNSE